MKVKELIATGKPFFIVAQVNSASQFAVLCTGSKIIDVSLQSFGGGEIWERQPTPAVSVAISTNPSE